jgi:hypothetical protein
MIQAARPWSIAELDLLRKHYKTMPPDKLAAMLGRTRIAVKDRAQKIGVCCPGGFGRRPWNKGKTFSKCRPEKDKLAIEQTIPRPTLGPWGCVW